MIDKDKRIEEILRECLPNECLIISTYTEDRGYWDL